MFDNAERTSSQQIVLYERATGKALARWSVDAREMLQQHPETYTLNASECQAPVQKLPPEAPSELTPTSLPAEHSPGVPLVSTKSVDAGAATPLAAPVRTTRAARKAAGK